MVSSRCSSAGEVDERKTLPRLSLTSCRSVSFRRPVYYSGATLGLVTGAPFLLGGLPAALSRRIFERPTALLQGLYGLLSIYAHRCSYRQALMNVLSILAGY
jgi:hypothetical protein